MDVSYLFAGIGTIILLGFLGSLLFERTKIPDILILIFIGLFLGPILTTYTDFGILDDPEMKSALITIAPIFSAMALVIILFDGGLNLNLEKTMQKLGVAIIHTGIAFIGTMFVTAVICFYFLNMDIVIGLLFGCILGGVSSAVVIPIMSGASANEDTKILLTLESVLTDVLCIVTALILIEILKGGDLDTGDMIQQLLTAFVLAAFIAFLFGILWLWVLKRLEGKPFSFMITIAALLVLYALAEYIHVSGAIAALVFGLVLSNKDEIARILKIKGSFVFDEHIRQFHSEVSFLIRTFFFVYLGITFVFSIGVDSFTNLAWFIPDWIADVPIYMFMILMGIIFIGMFIMRYVAATVTVSLQKESREDKSYIYAMIPRGLAAAVLAQLPFTIPEFTASLNADGSPVALASQTHYYQLISSYQNLFLNMAFMMIVLTVIATTIGVSAIERRRGESSESTKDQVKDVWEARSLAYRKAKGAQKSTDWESISPPPKIRTRPVPKDQTKPAPAKKQVVKKQSSTQRTDHPLVKRAHAAQKEPVKPIPKKAETRPKKKTK